MNRINLLKLAVILVLSAAAASTANASTSFTGTTIIGGNSFSTSNNVDIFVATNGTNGMFDGTTYCAHAKHEKGDKTMGSCAGDPKLYYYLGTSTADTSHVTAATTDVFTDTTIWQSM